MKKRHFLYFFLLCVLSGIITFSYAESFTKVTAKPLSDLLISSKSSVPATVVSLNYATLSAQISGKINRIRVKVGDVVAKNRTLLDIDCRDYVLAKKQAKAGLESAKAQQVLANKQYARNLTLRQSKTIPQSLLEEALLQTQVASADITVKRAALEQAKLSIGRCKIKAPFSGQITERLVSKGQLLAPNSPVFKLLQTEALEIRAELTPIEVVNARKAHVLSFNRGALQVPAKFRSVISEVEKASRTQQVRLVPESLDGLVVGYSGRVEWESKRSMLPADYLLRRNGVLGVMLLVKVADKEVYNSKFHVLPDASEGQPAFVDLPPTTEVIISNRFRLKPDEVVELE